MVRVLRRRDVKTDKAKTKETSWFPSFIREHWNDAYEHRRGWSRYNQAVKSLMTTLFWALRSEHKAQASI